MSTPLVPPRPTRPTGGSTAVKENGPQVPPRPARKLDPSPSRDTRSPLNELPNPIASIGNQVSQSNLSTSEVPPRPPSVQALPSVGQEGAEYASYDYLPPEAHGVSSKTSAELPELTRNVSENITLHAPTASIPQSAAKSRIATVTRTDSTQAAAAGIGRAKPDDDVHRTPADSTVSLYPVLSRTDDLRRVSSTEPHPLRQKTSFNRSNSSLPQGSSRPGSMHENAHEYEQGIPEIGRQIPLLPNAGDVQAPSPEPTQTQFTPGIGFFNDGSTRAHNRKRSGRNEFGPPGSYGLHSHSTEPHDQFEKDWYAKNPDKAMKEGYNVYGSQKPETALSSAELNKIVNQSNDAGMGTDPNMIGTPAEDIAFTASEEYVSRSRMTSPKASPAPLTEQRSKRHSSDAQPAVESPLRKMSFPFNANQRTFSDDAVEAEDDDVIHIDPLEQRANKITGGGPADGTIDLGPRAGNTEDEGGWFDERGEGVPILASDEVIKRPASAMMQPAVPPEGDHTDDYYESDHSLHDTSRRSSMRVPSRPSSRPNSMHGDYLGGNLHRFMSHDEHHPSGQRTPLEEIEEYEPLIPEEDEREPKQKPKATKRRPGLEHHHFPSQDVWEDTPMSLQYQTTVETPEPPREAVAAPPPKPTAFETPEEQQKRIEQSKEDMFSENKTFIKPKLAPDVHNEVHRPGMQRFPSRDIWEDTPDSMYHVTTVSSPQMDEAKSPPDDRPTTSAIPGSQDDGEARATTGFTQVMRPSVPTRPSKRSRLAEEIKPESVDEQQDGGPAERAISEEKVPSPDKAKAPAIPDRPKPTVPARPARPSRSDQTDAAGKAIAGDREIPTDDSAAKPAPKAKPAVPARPGGEKIAALKAGFMSDLNNRLKLGPKEPTPKAQEQEAEASREMPQEPLTDLKKGRTKGPARRKPAASAPAIAEEKPATFSISTTLTMWSTNEKDEIEVPAEAVTPTPEALSTASSLPNEPSLPELEKVLSDNEAQNVSEPTLTSPTSPEKSRSVSIADVTQSSGAIDEARRSSASPVEQRQIQADLQEKLAEVGAAPAPAAEPEAKDIQATSPVKDEAETPSVGEAVDEEIPAAKDN